MKKKMVMILVAFLMVTSIAGCKSNPTSGQSTSGQSSSSGGEFDDKELVVGVAIGSSIFNPYGTANINDVNGMSQIYDPILIKDSSGKIVPNLAEKFEISKDALTYTFWLKKGVKFSNGTELKASDVKFSLELGKESSFTSAVYANVESCEVVDDYTVIFHMKSPNVGFLDYLTSYYNFIVSEDVVNEYGKDFGTTVESVIGTGPYILKEWKPGELVVYEANPDYFKGAPDIKKVRFKAITDINAAVIALQTGEIGLYLNDIPGISMDSITNNEKLNLATFPSMKFVAIPMNNQSGPFTDIRMRQAVAYAVDRQEMNTVGTDGSGLIVDAPGGSQYTGSPDIKSWNYQVDIEKAKQLVKEAGMEGKTITIKTYTDNYLKLATVLQADLNSIGLKAEVVQVEMNTFFDQVWDKGEYEICITGWISGGMDMDEVMSGNLLTSNIGIIGNICRYSNPTMDELLMKARIETDSEARKLLYADAIELYTKDVPEIPLYFTNGSRAYIKDLVIDKGNVQFDKIYNYNWND